MDWINDRLETHGASLLERLCSRLSYDIHQFNRLPEAVRWNGSGYATASLTRYAYRDGDGRGAKIEVRPPRGVIHPHEGEDRNVVAYINAGERHVMVNFRGERPEIEVLMRDGEWILRTGFADDESMALWQVSQAILRPELFPNLQE